MGNNDVLITFPHAGGSSVLFNSWKKEINCSIYNVDYPGHWIRSDLALVNTFEELKNDIIKVIDPYVQKRDKIVFYGHSLGAILAWEIALYYLQQGLIIDGLCLSGSNNPESFSKQHGDVYISNSQLMEMIDYSESQHSESENREFYRNFMPLIRNDFMVCNSYKPTDSFCKIKTFILYGMSDPFTEYNQLVEWKKYSDCISFVGMTGKHMFIREKENRKMILQLLSSLLD